MPSPFPGMDPWLEDPEQWPDVHGALIYAYRAAIADVLPPGYSAKVYRYIWVEDPQTETRTRRGKPDTFVVDLHSTKMVHATTSAVLEPNTYSTFPSSKRMGNRFIRIVDRKDRRVVTVIELLSPSNKAPGEDRTFYLDKRKEYLASSTNLVEIDLLRDGDRLPMGKPKPRAADYYVVVSRASEFPRVGIWTLTVRDRLPQIPIPLKIGEAEVSLDLGECLSRIYDEAHIADDLDYSEPPIPELREQDAAWAAEILKKHARKRK